MQPHRPHKQGNDDDFGIRPDVAVRHAREKRRDRAGRPAGDKMLGSGDSVREHGVGSTGGHPGKGSGGDVAPEFLGLVPAPTGLTDPTRHPDGSPNIGGREDLHGSIQPSGPAAAQGLDHDNSQSGGGVANNRDHTENDAFVSEITADDATGRDLTQG